METMNKEELIKVVVEDTKLSKKDLEIALKGFINAIENAVADNKKVQLVGFGSFEPRERKERTAPAHPGKAGDKEKKVIPASIGVGFKAGKEFKDKVVK